jgi:hypothetical protein
LPNLLFRRLPSLPGVRISDALPLNPTDNRLPGVRLRLRLAGQPRTPGRQAVTRQLGGKAMAPQIFAPNEERTARISFMDL